MNGALLGVVAPVFGTVALGYGLARAGVLAQEVGAGLTRFMFFLAIPAMLFRGLAGAALPAHPPWAYLLSFYLPSFAVFTLALLLAERRLGWARHEAGLAGMTACYANIVLLGFPLSHAAFGAPGHLPLFLLVATQSTLLFPLATWALEIRAQRRAGGPRRLLAAMGRLAANPVLLALAAGFVANRLALELPAVPSRMLETLAAAGPACALVALGIGLAQYRLGGAWGEVALLVGLKNLLCPALVWGLGRAFALEPLWLATAVLMAAMPSGINAFIFASQYGLRQDAVAKTIVASTVVSALVVTLLLGRFLA